MAIRVTTDKGRGFRAFTVAEVLVCFALAGIVITNLWLIFGASHHQRLSADVKLQGVQSSIIFAERFESDGNCIAVDRYNPIEITANGTHISFATKNAKGQLDEISYEFSANDKSIRRVCNGKSETFKGKYEDVVFRLVELPQFLKMPPYTKKPPPSPKSGGRLEYLVTSMPLQTLAMPKDKRRGKDYTVLWGAVNVPTWLGRWKHQYWMKNRK